MLKRVALDLSLFNNRYCATVAILQDAWEINCQ